MPRYLNAIFIWRQRQYRLGDGYACARSNLSQVRAKKMINILFPMAGYVSRQTWKQALVCVIIRAGLRGEMMFDF